MIFSLHFHNNLHTFVWYSPYISLMFTLHFHNIIMMIIPSFFHLCFPPSAFSYYQQPYSCRHFSVELFSGKWIHAIYLSRTFLQPAIKTIPTIPSPTTATHVATSSICHVAHPNHPIPTTSTHVAISFPTRQDLSDPHYLQSSLHIIPPHAVKTEWLPRHSVQVKQSRLSNY